MHFYRCQSVVRGFSMITLVRAMYTKLVAILSGIKIVVSVDTVISPSTLTLNVKCSCLQKRGIQGVSSAQNTGPLYTLTACSTYAN